ncbi:MAG TPA: ABC transporter ATP-binding protein [Spirochaetota bacterium]|nr:ABC transporter ATP-binding protein [Spirochaetota bacterium]
MGADLPCPVIEVRALIKDFPEVRAVDNVSFAIERGSCFGLLGPNGAGKTTTIEVIEGILRPTAGEVLYKGASRTAGFRGEVGIQFQNTELPQYLSVRETLQVFRNLYDKKADLEYLIEICRLGEILGRDNRKISGGQRQRLLLAMALANDPDLVFLDEPTTGLDPQARRHLWDIVAKIKSENKTVILTTHYMEEAQILCDTIAIMDHGRVIALGAPEELLAIHCRGASIFLPGKLDAGKLEGVSCRWFEVENGIEIQTDSLNGCIHSLVGQGVDLSGMSVRSQNLEDLFLKITGSQLRS